MDTISEQIADRVTSVVAERMNVDHAAVTPDASFIDDLGADSLDMVDIMMALEEEFGLVIDHSDSNTITTAGEATSFVLLHRHASNKAA